MSERRDDATTPTGLLTGGAFAGEDEGGGLKRTIGVPQSRDPVGAAGVILATAFLVLVILGLLYGITTRWPVCELPKDSINAVAPAPGSGNANRSAANTSNSNAAAANSGVSANTGATANAQTNANAGGGVAQRAGAGNTNERGATPGANQPSGANGTKIVAPTVEPTSGPITGKTLVTIRGRDFGQTTSDVVVKFGEREAQVKQVTDSTISVATPRHSEGLVDVTVAKGTEVAYVLPSAFNYTCPRLRAGASSSCS